MFFRAEQYGSGGEERENRASIRKTAKRLECGKELETS